MRNRILEPSGVVLQAKERNMDPTIVAAIIGVVGAVLGGAVGALIAYNLTRRRMSDKEQFLRWRAVFYRRAFRAPYQFHSIPEPFEKAITDTILAITTGMARTRVSQTQLPNLGGKGMNFLKDKALRSTMEDVVKKLTRLQTLARALMESQAPPNPDDPRVREIDQLRDSIIETLNRIWDKYGIDTLPIPTTVPSDIYFKVEE